MPFVSTEAVDVAQHLPPLHLTTGHAPPQTASIVSSPTVEMPEAGLLGQQQPPVKKSTTDTAAAATAAPPKITELSALEQELQKLHLSRRVTPELHQMSQAQEPHMKTYSEVLKQDPPPQPVVSAQQQTLAAPADPSKVRKVSRFNVSVVKEQEKEQQTQQKVPIQQMIPQQQSLQQQAPQQMSQLPPQQQQIVQQPPPQQHILAPNNNKQQLNLNLQTAQPMTQSGVEIMSLMPKTTIGK